MAKTKQEEIRELFSRLAGVLGCNGTCEERCVFYDVGTGPGCPLNQFEDRCVEALGGAR